MRIAIAVLALCACSADDRGSDPVADADADTDADTDADVQDDPPDWSANWRVEVDWEIACDVGFDNIKTESGSDAWMLKFSGPADDLEVWVDDNSWYTMTGFGDEDSLYLCGSFPMYDLSGDSAPSGTDNNLCIDADELIASDELHGELTGKFQGGFGEDCEMTSGTLVLTK